MKKLILSLVLVLATGMSFMNANTITEGKNSNQVEIIDDCFDRVYEIISTEEYEDLSVEGVQWLYYWMCES